MHRICLAVALSGLLASAMAPGAIAQPVQKDGSVITKQPAPHQRRGTRCAVNC